MVYVDYITVLNKNKKVNLTAFTSTLTIRLLKLYHTLSIMEYLLKSYVNKIKAHILTGKCMNHFIKGSLQEIPRFNS